MPPNNRKFRRLAIIAAISFGLIAPNIAQAKSPPPERSLLPLIPSGGTKVLDWTRIRFQSFGGMHKAGQFKAPPQLTSYLGFDPSVAWSKGTPVASVIRLGFVDQAFGLQLLSLDQIAAYTGINVQSLPLAAYGLLKWQTLGTLVQAVPGLANLYVSQVPPIATLVGNYGYFNLTIGQLLATQPGLATLPLTPILNSYAIGSIPGLSATPIDRFHLWKAAFISDIPGLSQLVFARFPIQPKSPFQSRLPNPSSTGLARLTQPLLVASLTLHRLIAQSVPPILASGAAIFDIPFMADGLILINTITGSDRVGFNFPCHQPLCPHIELGLPFQGARFISGTDQWVFGGHNLLGELFGSLEPTGRPLVGNPDPEKEPFKLLLNWADDSTGTAMFGLAMHWCIHHSWPDPLPNPDCTPYIFEFPGVWLWFEQEVAFIGGPGIPSRP